MTKFGELIGSQTPTLQAPSSPEQSTGVPAQLPAVHESAVVQRSPSSQSPPSLAGVLTQSPDSESQVP